jgi:hypothetical protein
MVYIYCVYNDLIPDIYCIRYSYSKTSQLLALKSGDYHPVCSYIVYEEWFDGLGSYVWSIVSDLLKVYRTLGYSGKWLRIISPDARNILKNAFNQARIQQQKMAKNVCKLPDNIVPVDDIHMTKYGWNKYVNENTLETILSNIMNMNTPESNHIFKSIIGSNGSSQYMTLDMILKVCNTDVYRRMLHTDKSIGRVFIVNPNVTFEFIENHPYIGWGDLNGYMSNINITMDTIRRIYNKEIPGMTLNQWEISSSKCLDISFVYESPELSWDYDLLMYNPNIDLSFIISNIDKLGSIVCVNKICDIITWDQYIVYQSIFSFTVGRYMVKNSTVTTDIFLTYCEEYRWLNSAVLYDNINITVEFILDNVDLEWPYPKRYKPNDSPDYIMIINQIVTEKRRVYTEDMYYPNSIKKYDVYCLDNIDSIIENISDIGLIKEILEDIAPNYGTPLRGFCCNPNIKYDTFIELALIPSIEYIKPSEYCYNANITWDLILRHLNSGLIDIKRYPTYTCFSDEKNNDIVVKMKIRERNVRIFIYNEVRNHICSNVSYMITGYL